MKKIELLSPAGDMESLKMAVMAGCDAVYLGGEMFGARAFSKNFSNEELKEAIKYAHLYNVKVYVTANILILEHEVERFMEYIDFLYKSNVDAIIMQDLGMIDLVRKTYPNIEIHASTQMHIHNLDGVLLAEKMGLKRVVLARETSIDDILYIKKNSTIDLEIFIHGALCVSYSGQCLFSSLVGNRSGNRGSCVGSCRLPYKIIDENNNKLNRGDYPLSMKDLNTLSNIGELIDNNVSSLKIEGRMKSPEYVYTVTKLYRIAIDSYYKDKVVSIDNKELNNLKKIFNRNYTKGFLFKENMNNIINDIRPNHLGIKIGNVIKYNNSIVYIKLTNKVSINDGIRILNDNNDYGLLLNEFYINNKLVKEAKENDIISFKANIPIKEKSEVLLTKDNNLLKEIDNICKLNPRKILINGIFKCLKNKEISLTLNDGVNEVNILGKIPEKALNNPISKELIKEKILKLGNTIYNFSELTIELDDNLFINIKDLNEIKYKAIDELNKKRLYSYNYQKQKYDIELPNFQSSKQKSILVHSFNNECQNYDKCYTEIKNNNSILKIPKIINNYQEYDKNTCYLVGEIGALNYFKDFICDYSFNVTNSYTLAFLHSIGAKMVTLSLELTLKQIDNIIINYIKRYNKLPNTEVIVYGYMEVMSLKLNLNKLYNNDKLYLVDRFNNKYKIMNKNNITYIYHYKLLNEDINQYYNIGVNSVRYNKEII